MTDSDFTFDFLGLYPEIRIYIAKFVPYKDLPNFCLTCKTVRNEVCLNDFFWKMKICHDWSDSLSFARQGKWKTRYQELRTHVSFRLPETILKGGLDLTKMLLDFHRRTGVLKLNVQRDISPVLFGDGTALMIASYKGYRDLVQTLLELGADPNIQTEYGKTALMRATFNGHIEIAGDLLRYGADPNLQDQDYNDEEALKENYVFEKADTALSLASSSYPEIAELLLESKADPNIIGPGLLLLGTPLESACRSKDPSLFQNLLKFGADPNYQDSKGKDMTALMGASMYGFIDYVRQLLKLGADPNLQDDMGQTALMYAIGEVDSVEVIQELLKWGADPNLKDEDGKTALDLAIEDHSSDEFVNILWKAKKTFQGEKRKRSSDAISLRLPE